MSRTLSPRIAVYPLLKTAKIGSEQLFPRVVEQLLRRLRPKERVPLASAKMPSYCKDHLWLSLLQPISHSEKAFLHFNWAFLHVKTACNAISSDLTASEEDCVKIPKRHFRTD